MAVLIYRKKYHVVKYKFLLQNTNLQLTAFRLEIMKSCSRGRAEGNN